MRLSSETRSATEVRDSTIEAYARTPIPTDATNTSPDTQAIPTYLSQAYSWAYLARFGVWFFDHQPIINAILLGQYRRLMRTSIALLDPQHAGDTLQLAAVYGVLTPTLARRLPRGKLHLIDVAPVQLRKVGHKLDKLRASAHLSQMNAEDLGYVSNSFDTVLIYFLLHELPESARRHTLGEALRVLRPGGAFVIAEYGELAHPNLLHHLRPVRTLFEHAEPYLGEFWSHSLDERVRNAAADNGKTVVRDRSEEILGGFYRVVRYRVQPRAGHRHVV